MKRDLLRKFRARKKAVEKRKEAHRKEFGECTCDCVENQQMATEIAVLKAVIEDVLCA